MNDIVMDLIIELEKKGWSVTKPDKQLKFSREGIVITSQQMLVTAELSNFSITKIANKYLTTLQRLEFLIEQIRQFADMADTGKLTEMARWASAQNAIKKASWEQALNCPEALLLLEKAVGMLSNTANSI